MGHTSETSEESCLRFIHLSDIHLFRTGGDPFDEDTPIRKRLIQDLQRLRQATGPINGVLVTGDVAFSGAANQYDEARQFLLEVTKAIECGLAEVHTVPGNHDVDRRKAANAAQQAIYNSLRSLDSARRTNELNKLLEDPQSAPILLAPLDEYLSKFAKHYDCSFTAKPPWWEETITFGACYKLKIRGMTSVLTSDSRDSDTGEHRLILGSTQANVDLDPGIVNMTLCHHPPEWLHDRESLENTLNNTVHVQLYGHVHHHAVELRGKSLVITAGALHPAREEDPWDPRYNLIELSIQGSAERPMLRVGVVSRQWNSERHNFGEEVEDYEEHAVVHDLELVAAPAKTEGAATVEMDHNQDQLRDVKEQRVLEGIGPMTPQRTLMYLFLDLDYEVQRDILRKLSILPEGFQEKSEPELFAEAMVSAIEKCVLHELWDEVVRVSGREGELPNPFKDLANG